jgi:ParB/RepB/Spo0J family partition protein
LFQSINPYGVEAQPAQGEPTRLRVDWINPVGAIVPLEQVRPDPNQPRHVLPLDIAGRFERTQDAAEALDEWARLGREGDTAAAQSYAALESLANSIAADGLIQPISVAPTSDGYHIETGERRWWAHQLLNKQGRTPKDGKAGHIEAIVRNTGGPTLIRQLAENLHRQDLCAVETAAGLAALIAEIERQSVPIGTLTADERLAELRVIAGRRLQEGTWAEIVKRLGKSRPVWARHLALLRLPNDAMALALYHRLPEGALRPAVAEPDPKRQLALVEAAIKRQQREQDKDAQTASAAKVGTDAGLDGAIAFRRKLVSGLRGFSRAFQSLDGGRVNTRAMVKEIAEDEHFDEIAATAKQLLPVLEAVVKAKPSRKGK